ncbi:MAG TPA: polysaccharide deacetylase family protein [Negativicutes bacterium]|nr:polysaccharide deacetylase family protein [Negativicutes bacterium]
MFIIVSRQYFNAAIAVVGVISLSLLSVAMHPHFEEWKREGIVVTMVDTRTQAVALTFDDGPQPEVTPKLLEILRRHKAHATFFVLGSQADKHPDIVKKTMAQGNEIANHGYGHQFTRYNNLDYAIEDIETANQSIKKITGVNNRLFRPPGGYLSDAMVDYCRRQKYLIVTWTWNQDTKDWTFISGQQIANHILQNLEPGQIIILHDGGSQREEMLKGVDLLLTGLEAKGYKAVTVSELLKIAK